MKKIKFNKKILLIPIILGLFVLGWYVKEEVVQKEKKGQQSQKGVYLSEAQSSPEEVVSTFYDWYIKELKVCTGMEKTRDCEFDFENGETEREFVTKNFHENVLSDRDGHSNPIICAQDLPDRMNDNSFQVVDQKQKGHVSVLVHLVYSISGDNRIKVELTQTDDQWRIDNITCSD
ncbi:MAG: DUF3828 domain-containing protein [Patescibacteria group bacterium]|nr:DUF3828 domain-containing protein [Patescibacteria group bacterium]